MLLSELQLRYIGAFGELSPIKIRRYYRSPAGLGKSGYSRFVSGPVLELDHLPEA